MCAQIPLFLRGRLSQRSVGHLPSSLTSPDLLPAAQNPFPNEVSFPGRGSELRPSLHRGPTSTHKSVGCVHGSVAPRCLMIDSETNSTVPTPGTYWSIPFIQDPPDESRLVGISESLGQTGVPAYTPVGGDLLALRWFPQKTPDADPPGKRPKTQSPDPNLPRKMCRMPEPLI